jgi:hypothetical protein
VKIGDSFKIVISTSEEVKPLTPDSLILEGGTVKEIRKLSKNSYSMVITPNEDAKKIFAQVEAEKVFDLAGNFNENASNEINVKILTTVANAQSSTNPSGELSQVQALLDKVVSSVPTCNYSPTGMLITVDPNGKQVNTQGCPQQNSQAQNTQLYNCYGQMIQVTQPCQYDPYRAQAQQQAQQQAAAQQAAAQRAQAAQNQALGGLLGNLLKGGLGNMGQQGNRDGGRGPSGPASDPSPAPSTTPTTGPAADAATKAAKEKKLKELDDAVSDKCTAENPNKQQCQAAIQALKDEICKDGANSPECKNATEALEDIKKRSDTNTQGQENGNPESAEIVKDLNRENKCSYLYNSNDGLIAKLTPGLGNLTNKPLLEVKPVGKDGPTFYMFGKLIGSRQLSRDMQEGDKVTFQKDTITKKAEGGKCCSEVLKNKPGNPEECKDKIELKGKIYEATKEIKFANGNRKK